MNLETINKKLETILLATIQQEERLSSFNERMTSSSYRPREQNGSLEKTKDGVLDRIYDTLDKIEYQLSLQAENLMTTESFLVDLQLEVPNPIKLSTCSEE